MTAISQHLGGTGPRNATGMLFKIGVVVCVVDDNLVVVNFFLIVLINVYL